MKKFLIVAYLVALHIVVAVLLFRPQIVDENRWRLNLPLPEPSTYAIELHKMHQVMDRQALDGGVVLIGSSQFQRIPPDLLPKNTRNFGIGGDTVRNMISRVQDYQSLAGAEAIFIWAGYNDLLRRKPETVAKDMEKLLDMMPDDQNVFLLGLAPVGSDKRHGVQNETIEKLNSFYAELCQSPCQYLDTKGLLGDADGLLQPGYDSGDGLHLNRQGSARIAGLVTAQLAVEN